MRLKFLWLALSVLMLSNPIASSRRQNFECWIWTSVALVVIFTMSGLIRFSSKLREIYWKTAPSRIFCFTCLNRNVGQVAKSTGKLHWEVNTNITKDVVSATPHNEGSCCSWFLLFTGTLQSWQCQISPSAEHLCSCPVLLLDVHSSVCCDNSQGHPSK